MILALFAFSVTSCFAQLGGATTAEPPAHLPRLIHECETGPNYNACSFWRWDGSAYAAIWQNGAVGHLTVASGDSPQLRVQRQDAAGASAGLSATYTGKWDGTTFSEGKLAFTWKGTSGNFDWTGAPAVTPVMAEPDGMFANWYPAQLTAYTTFH